MANKKTLVVYYSMSGRAMAAAQSLAAKLGAELEEIVPVEPVGTGFSMYWRLTKAAFQRQSWAVRPSLRDLSDYDLVVIVGPVWAGRICSPIRGWLKAHALAAHTELAVLTTVGGLSSKKAFAEIETLAGRTAIARQDIRERDWYKGRFAERLSVLMQGLGAAPAA